MNQERVVQPQHSLQNNPSLSGGILQRKCVCGQKKSGGSECTECKKKRQSLQRKARTESQYSEIPPIVKEVLRSAGEPLDNATRAFMEPRFSRDFSRVRVHKDTKAMESANAVNALAYTVGQDIVFAAGKYFPASSPGRGLLAHELTHTLQQQKGNAGVLRPTLIVSHSNDAYEDEAVLRSDLI